MMILTAYLTLTTWDNMKRIIFFILFSSLAFAQVSSRTTIFKLPQWTAGNKLSAGTASDSSVSNDGLNNGFYRLETILGRQVNGSGLFTSLYGTNSANLTLRAGSSHNYRLVFDDSTYSNYNSTFAQNVWVQGNATVGGYITTDSVIISGGGLFLNGTIGVSDNAHFYDTTQFDEQVDMLSRVNVGYDLRIGQSFSTGGIQGKLYFYRGSNDYYVALKSASQSADREITIPARSSNTTLATQTENDSVQAPTVYTVLFNSEKVASSTLNDTSALFTEWTSNSNDEYPIVRLKYVHRAGIKYVVARYYAYIGTGDNWEANIKCGSLTSTTTSGSNSSYGSMSTTTLDVSGLTANAIYDLKFNIGTNTLGTSHFKELVLTAESQ